MWGSVKVRSSCEWCLGPNQHQGWYGEHFVAVLSAATGLQVTWLTPDCTGVDLHLAFPGELGGERFPRIEVQVKSWSQPRNARGSEDSWSYVELTQKRFSALAGPFRVPRYLFVVIVPKDASDYAQAEVARLTLQRAAYWVSLKDQLPIDNASCHRKMPVQVPKSNLLTAESLLGLLRPAPVEVAS